VEELQRFAGAAGAADEAVIASEARQSIVPAGGRLRVCERDGSPRCARDDEVLAIFSH